MPSIYFPSSCTITSIYPLNMRSPLVSSLCYKFSTLNPQTSNPNRVNIVLQVELE